MLVVRGRPLPTRGAIIEHSLGRAPRPYHIVLPALLGSVVVVVLLGALHGSYRAALITSLIMAVISLSLVVVTGYCGQISLAQMTFAGAAAFLLSRFTSSWGLPFPIAPLLASLVAALIGVLIGLPALRIRGLLVGVVTLALAVTVEALWFRNNDFNGGTAGSPVTVCDSSNDRKRSTSSRCNTSEVRTTLSIASSSSTSNGRRFPISRPSDITADNIRYNDYRQDEFNANTQPVRE